MMKRVVFVAVLCAVAANAAVADLMYGLESLAPGGTVPSSAPTYLYRFNDNTPAIPVGGNDGTTVGQQRLIAFQYAADLWGARIDTDVTIRVEASFDPLNCNSFGAVLGAAGPETAHSDFSGAPRTNTWYPAALANAITDSDNNGGQVEIVAFFNRNLGQPNCLTGTFFYYGLDGNEGLNIDFVTVLAHELGHGFVPLVRAGPLHGSLAAETTAPRLLTHVLRRDEFLELDRLDLRPEAGPGTAEIRDARLRADAGAGEYHHPARGIDHRAKLIEIVHPRPRYVSCAVGRSQRARRRCSRTGPCAPPCRPRRVRPRQ